MAALLYHQLLSSVAPLPAEARVEPLTRITRQIHKPNMLILLDTSGSLTGVPGGTFDYSKEVGVDCDDGINCRGGLSQGTCATSGKGCASDDQCTSGSCQVGYAACGSNVDCPPVPGKCASGDSCFTTADCPPLATGHCSGTGAVCDSTHPCDSQLTCRYNSAHKCTLTSNDCKPGICGELGSDCNSDTDCPYATSGGTCAYGTTPGGGCATAAQCPVRAAVCSDNPSRTCTTVNDCGGICAKNKNACASNADCAKNNDTCDFSGKTCASPSNSCLLPRVTCNITHSDNACVDRNPCVPDPNPCSGPQPNTCVGGSPNDSCKITSSGGSEMCRTAQTLCTSDATCSAIAGDTCGPATSRMVIAKRVIRNVIAANANVVNLGLMTFYQAGYFPYFVVSGTTTTTTKSVDIKQGSLEAAKCYTKRTGLAATCTIDGQTYQLRGGNNARYLIKGNGSAPDKYVDAPYCGWFCAIPGVGTGIFKGGYYQYQDVQGPITTQVNMPTYMGKVFVQNGVTYRYYDSRPDYYNGGPAPPIQVVNCGNTCSATCGARWDTQLAPFLTTDDSAQNIDAVITAFNQALEPANNGGLIAYGGAPTGCALDNNGAQDVNHSAYSYMQAVKAADTLLCRQNYILFVADGESNGPGDVNCTAAACSADDPVGAGCTCRAVLSAYKLRQQLGVKTFVVGFSVDGATGTGRIINENIAKAGGTDAADDGVAPYAFSARNEAQLNDAIQKVIYQAAQGSYSTSPATASQGSIHGASEQAGDYLLDARVDFPTWKGHLVAYDLSSAAPTLVWDAAAKLASRDWRTRRVYTADASNNLILISVDPTTGAIRNKDQLYALGLGATPDEADKIARWFLGDPTLTNPAVLGAMINSTPIDIGAPADGTSPGLHAFYLNNMGRPSVTYVGADDGMLHAFYTKDVTINGVSYQGGSESFAYMPMSMLPMVTKLFAQGGQMADPRQHIYGLASSPKMKSICVQNCTDDSAVWKTVLVMTEGFGGNGLFMLDVTNPLASTPFQLMWSSSTSAQASTFNTDLGLTASVPAFTFVPSAGMNDYRLLMSSGYPTVDGSSTQGRYLVSTSATTGAITTANVVTAGGGCSQDYTLITDVGTARRQSKDSNGTSVGRKEFLAGYFGDTWGNLWRYTSTDGVQLLNALGCDQPLHFSPTVVQPDADDPSNPGAGNIYLVQATNSSLDVDTQSFSPSKMVVMKETFGATGGPRLDTTFGKNGQLVLTSANGQQLCGQTNATGDTCLTPLPANARPLATPTGLLKADGTGFITLSNWYAQSADGCGKGSTYLMIHDFSGSSFTLKQALKIADEPVVNPVIVKGNLMVSTSTGPISIAGSITTRIVSAVQPLTNLGDPFQMSGWTEVQ
jgi:hypothetical protein